MDRSLLRALLSERYLVGQIAVGIVVGVVLALWVPEVAQKAGLLGTLFVAALKAAAPLLVFVLVLQALAAHQASHGSRFSPIIVLYLVGTVSAAFIAFLFSQFAPPKLALLTSDTTLSAPQSIDLVLKNLLLKLVDNPINALVSANFIGVLAWACVLGLALRSAGEPVKQVLTSLADAMTQVVRWIIRAAPLGIFGLVAVTVAQSGLAALAQYGQLLAVLVSSMVFVALVINPLLYFAVARKNPFPVVVTSLRESGVTAFFTRSSAANIPVNLNLCERLGLNRDIYSVSIPLGATVNMAGAAITITVMTLAAVNTLGIQVHFATALLLCLVASVSACGASGVAGGSLLLIPLACNLFGISGDVAMQVVAVGFVIGVLQDSAETALNSSTDVVFTAACCERAERG